MTFVFPDDSSMIVSTSDNEIDMADLEGSGDTKVGIIMSQGRHTVSPDSFEVLGFFNCALQKYLIFDRMHRTRMNQWQALTAHRSKRDEDVYEFQEYIFTIALTRIARSLVEARSRIALGIPT